MAITSWAQSPSKSSIKKDLLNKNLYESYVAATKSVGKGDSKSAVINALNFCGSKFSRDNLILNPLKSAMISFCDGPGLIDNLSDQKNEMLQDIVDFYMKSQDIDVENQANSITENNFKLAQPIPSTNDDIIVEFQCALAALILTLSAKVNNDDSISFKYKELIINAIHEVHRVNKTEYVHYENLESNNNVVLQELFSSLGIIRSYTAIDTFLIKSDLLNPFSFNELDFSRLKESDISLLNEQICHLFNSHSQTNRKGITLMLNDSFMECANKDITKTGKINLSAEEYSRFCQSEIFVVVVKDCGVIVLDHSNILAPFFHIFLILSGEPTKEISKLSEEHIALRNKSKDLVNILQCVFKRDAHRSRALGEQTKKSYEYYVFNITPDLKEENETDKKLDRVRKSFLITTFISVFSQGNPWPVKFDESKEESQSIFDNYLEFYFDDNNNISIKKSSNFSVMLKSFFERNTQVLTEVVNNCYSNGAIDGTDVFSMGAIFSQVMALLGHFLCLHKSIFTLTGMGVDDDDFVSALCFFRDFMKVTFDL